MMHVHSALRPLEDLYYCIDDVHYVLDQTTSHCCNSAFTMKNLLKFHRSLDCIVITTQSENSITVAARLDHVRRDQGTQMK